MDPKTWLIFTYTVCSSIPNGGLTSFSSILISGLGFDIFTALLLNMPGSATCLTYALVSTYLAHRFKYSRCILIAILQLVALNCCAMVYALPTEQKWARLGGMWLFPTYAADMPLNFSIIAFDITGNTKKTTVLAILFIGYCTRHIIGPQLFFPQEAPKYGSAFEGILVCMGLAAVSIMGLRQYMSWENMRRDLEQGVVIDLQAKRRVNTEEHWLRQGWMRLIGKTRILNTICRRGQEKRLGGSFSIDIRM